MCRRIWSCRWPKPMRRWPPYRRSCRTWRLQQRVPRRDCGSHRPTWRARRKRATALSGIIIQQAQGALESAQADLDELRKREPVLTSQRDALQRSRDAAAKRLELKVDELQALDTARRALAGAEAQLQQANVAVTEAELQLERMTIRAPAAAASWISSPRRACSSCRAGFRWLEGRDSSTVVTMYQPDKLQVRVDVRFEDLPRVGREQPVQIESPAVPRTAAGARCCS